MANPIRIRAHIETPQAKHPASDPAAASRRPARRSAEFARRRALVLHVLADDDDQAVAVFFRETFDGRTRREGIAVPDDTAPGSHLLSWASTKRQDLPPGIIADLNVETFSELGKLLVKRCYRFGTPLVGWDLGWQLCRLAGHVGRSVGGAFSVSLHGCGKEVEGKWKDSDYRRRLRVTPRGSGQSAFVRWLAPRDEQSMPKGLRPQMVDIANLLGTVAGADVSCAEDAAALLGVAFEHAEDRLDAARAACKALAAIYEAARARLDELAPGMAPSAAFSTGSIVTHNRRTARIRPTADVMSKLDPSDKGAAAGAFRGPRCEAALVGVAMPMALVDLRGTYPACWSALRLTALLVAESIEFEDGMDEYRELLDAPDLVERLLDPVTAATWGATVVTLDASDGAILSASVDWSPTRHGGTVAPLFFPGGTGLPTFWCEAALARARGGQFTVRAARRPIARGVQRGLKPYRMLDGTEIDVRRDDLGLAWRRVRDRMAGPAKLAGQVDTFGHGARHDLKSLDTAVELAGTGRRGERLTATTKRPEYPAEYTSLLLSGAVSSFAQVAVGLTELSINVAGGVLAHVATDSILVPSSRDGGLWPCPEGDARMPDGRAAVRLVAHDELRRILAQLDPLLGYDGRSAWKEEAGSLAESTLGIVFGVNKVVLAREDAAGELRVVRSTDAHLGGHLLDPTGLGRMTDDERWQWAAELEGHLLAAAIGTDPGRSIAVPKELPEWASALALRESRVSTWDELRRLRQTTGDPTILPLARYVQVETGGRGGAPVALGHHPDPSMWPSLDWRLGGVPVRIDVLGADGTPRFAGGDRRAPRHVIGHTVAEYLRGWLREHDPSMTGPRRGLRHPTKVHTDPGLVRMIGRSVDDFDSATAAQLEFQDVSGWADLRRRAAVIGPSEIARLVDLPVRTAFDAVNRDAVPSPSTRAAIADAVARAMPRECLGCGAELYGPANKTTCGERCRKRAYRASRREGRRAEVSALDTAGAARPANRTWSERAPSWEER